MGAGFIGCLVLIIILMATIISPIASEINCQSILPSLFPCLGYLIGAGANQPSDACCSATLNVVKLALQSQENLQSVCTCFEQVASSAPFPINMDKAKDINKLCKLPIDIPISTTLDCKTLTLPKSPIAPPVSPAPAPALAPGPVEGGSEF